MSKSKGKAATKNSAQNAVDGLIAKSMELLEGNGQRPTNLGGNLMRPLVILESPYQGKSQNTLLCWWQRRRNIRYAKLCLQDSLACGEAPIASHLLYTQVLNDLLPDERQWSIEAGLEWLRVADKHIVYIDLGISTGMKQGIEAARAYSIPTEMRRLWK